MQTLPAPKTDDKHTTRTASTPICEVTRGSISGIRIYFDSRQEAPEYKPDQESLRGASAPAQFQEKLI